MFHDSCHGRERSCSSEILGLGLRSSGPGRSQRWVIVTWPGPRMAVSMRERMGNVESRADGIAILGAQIAVGEVFQSDARNLTPSNVTDSMRTVPMPLARRPGR